MIFKHTTMKYGIISFAIYLIILILFAIYFNVKTNEKKPVHFVKKNDTSISVKTIVEPPKKVKPKVVKKVQKPKIIKEKKIKNVEVNKKIKNLFDNVVLKDEVKKIEPKKEKSIKKEDKGIVNEYFAAVEEILYSWPAQSSFAGEMATVLMTINKSGSFTFKIKNSSGNDSFNNALNEYLKQLQLIKLPKHNSNKDYKLKFIFSATEQ